MCICPCFSLFNFQGTLYTIIISYLRCSCKFSHILSAHSFDGTEYFSYCQAYRLVFSPHIAELRCVRQFLSLLLHGVVAALYSPTLHDTTKSAPSSGADHQIHILQKKSISRRRQADRLIGSMCLPPFSWRGVPRCDAWPTQVSSSPYMPPGPQLAKAALRRWWCSLRPPVD